MSGSVDKLKEDSQNENALESAVLLKKEDIEAESTELEAAEHENGVVSTTFQLVAMMIGSGILAFPYVFKHAGGFFAVPLTLFIGWVLVVSSNMLVLLVEKKQQENPGSRLLSYSGLVDSEFGRRGRQVLAISISVATFGAYLSYLNIIGDVGSKVWNVWWPGSFLGTYAGCMTFFVVLFDLPVVIACRTFGEVAMVSFASLAFTVVLVCMVGFPEMSKYSDTDFHVIPVFPSSTGGALRQFGSIAYAMNCQAAVLEAYTAMTPAAKKQWPSTITAATAIGIVLLMTMGVMGYGNFGDDTKGDIFENMDETKGVVQMAEFLVVIHLFLYIPNDFIICRLFLCNAFDQDPQTMPFTQHLAWTIGLFTAGIGLMASVPPSAVGGVFSFIISLTGELPTAVYSYILPGVLYILVFGEQKGLMWGAAHIIVFLGILSFVVSPIITVTHFINACESDEGCSSF